MSHIDHSHDLHGCRSDIAVVAVVVVVLRSIYR